MYANCSAVVPFKNSKFILFSPSLCIHYDSYVTYLINSQLTESAYIDTILHTHIPVVPNHTSLEHDIFSNFSSKKSSSIKENYEAG